MDTEGTPRITHVERLTYGLIVTFDSGRCALYSASLLNSFFDQAESLLEDEDLEPGIDAV